MLHCCSPNHPEPPGPTSCAQQPNASHVLIVTQMAQLISSHPLLLHLWNLIIMNCNPWPYSSAKSLAASVASLPFPLALSALSCNLVKWQGNDHLLKTLPPISCGSSSPTIRALINELTLNERVVQISPSVQKYLLPRPLLLITVRLWDGVNALQEEVKQHLLTIKLSSQSFCTHKILLIPCTTEWKLQQKSLCLSLPIALLGIQ